MKRWLVVLLVTLALVVLISPGIVGRMAEKNIEDSIAWAEADSPGVTVSTETFERGWFTSEGRHRVVFEGGQFRDATEIFSAATGSSKLPSLLIDTRLDHGLVPVTSLGREEGSLAPGLASTVSTFQLDGGDGQLIEIPGALYSNVGIAGTSDARLLLEPAKLSYENATLEWQGTDLNVHTNPSARSRSIEGIVESISLGTETVSAALESLDVQTNQMATEYGFNLGDAVLNLKNISFDTNGAGVSVENVSITVNSDLEDGRIAGGTTFALNSLTGPTGQIDARLQMSFNEFDAASFGVISAALREAQGANDPQAALMEIYPAIEGEVQTLLTKGVEFSIDQLEVSLPQGVLTTTLSIDVAESDLDDSFSWPGVILSTTASVDVRVPEALYDMIIMLNPEANALVAMGIFKKDGSDYVMDADYAKGLINVNGAPMPIPIPGL